ncbi:MAG TPA: SRPBCC family protein [Saprospiraceae bacterium]|nr:SRPBCC family protein [Saprospiraceae bacterium]HMQ85618.1 SRPBCC family protein [Saprospiraceae bacterium]
MTTTTKTPITVTTTVHAPIEKVWACWTDPKHIVHWNHASDDWHTTKAENDLQAGGKFSARMEAKDGSVGFDFGGVYEEVQPQQFIAYTMEDGRKVEVAFTKDGDTTHVKETFDAENFHSIDMQRSGWQAILDNFKHYAEKPLSTDKLHFEIHINADVEQVYRTMIAPVSYAAWTAEFNPSSRFEGSWEKGAKISFIGEDQDGNCGGMVSRIKENIPYEFISIEHLGVIENGQEITSGPHVDAWAGALENYTFKAAQDGTLLQVDMESNPEFEAYFSETWPKALAKLKSICEA